MATDTKIRQIPGIAQVEGPASMAPSVRGVNPAIDVSSQFQGAQALAQGVASLGGSVQNVGDFLGKRERTADAAAADAAWLKGSLDLGNDFQKRTDFTKFEADAGSQTAKLRDQAAALIRDPDTRQAWLQATEMKRTSLIDAVKDHATDLSNDADRAKLTTALDDQSKLIADPTTPEAVRQAALKGVETSIKIAAGSGLVSATEAVKLRQASIEASQEQLAFNRASTAIQFGNPQTVLNGMGIPTEAGGAGILAATTQAQGGTLTLDPALAKVTADMLGDSGFPTDPKLVKAYLADPEKAQQYQTAAVGMLNQRYKGDLTATVIALDPKGGTVLADKWVKSNHDENVLPPDVRARYRTAMTAFRPAISGDRIPIQAAPGLDLNTTDPGVLQRFEQMQTAFGEAVPLIEPAAKSGHVDGQELTLDISNLPADRRTQLVQMASSMGFTGLGFDKNTLTLATGPRQTWGNVQPWAKPVLDAHTAGTAGPPPLLFATVAPEYAALSYDKRLQLAAQAKQAMKETDALQRASLEGVISDAPTAIANTGKYDPPMPDATAFVRAYGATEGIQRYRQFETAIDTAKTMYGFRAEPEAQIMAAVRAATPTSSGVGADLEQKRFDAIQAAAEHTIKAREDDPATYVMQTFPKVADAMKTAQASGDKPWVQASALSLMATTQEQLGIQNPKLLPKDQAVGAVAAFNNTALPADQRLAGVARLLLTTSDPKIQGLIYKQLLDEKLPEYTQGAFAAMMRGDSGGAANLMRAVMIDPDKIAGALPVKQGEIDAAIQSGVFEQGAIGDVMYGSTAGNTDSFARMQADSTLLNRDVKLHLMDGSAGGDVNKAVDLAVKDMWGDVQTVVQPGVKITLPAGTDPAPMVAGFAALHPAVSTALKEDMANGLIQIMGKDTDLRSTGMAAIYKAGIDNAVEQVMANGWFEAAPGGFRFFNPYTGAVIGGSDGKPLTFTEADVKAAGAANPNGGSTGQFPGMGGR